MIANVLKHDIYTCFDYCYCSLANRREHSPDKYNQQARLNIEKANLLAIDHHIREVHS